MNELWTVLIVFICGTILGSFINAWTFRLGTGLSIVSKRSMCDACASPIAWYDMIPVVSYIILRGRCRICQSRFSWLHLCVEFLTGVIFVLTYLVYGITLESIGIGISLLFLIALVIYDIRHTIIPDEYVYPFIALSFALLFISGNTIMVPSLSDIVSGPLFFLFFFILWFFSKGKWMGFADSKLALGIGWVLGLSKGITALCLSFWSGAIIMLGIMIAERLFLHKKGLNLRSEVPFAPFLALGFLYVLFTNWTLFPWL